MSGYTTERNGHNIWNVEVGCNTEVEMSLVLYNLLLADIQYV